MSAIIKHQYLLKLCRALIKFGLPAHRLERYMLNSALSLNVDGEFRYTGPGEMTASFRESGATSTTTEYVREGEGVNLAKLRSTHKVYKRVKHDDMDLEEAVSRLDEILQTQNRFSDVFLILIYGLGSLFIGPVAFGARLIDLPLVFLVGCIPGYLQYILSLKPDLSPIVLEFIAAVTTSFLGRALGSIQNGDLFCYSAIAQSSIALLLPSALILSGALELQSRHVTAGAQHIFSAVWSCVVLSFGINMGSKICENVFTYASMDLECRGEPLESWYSFFFMTGFIICLIIIMQSKVKHMLPMIIFGIVGYYVVYFGQYHFSQDRLIPTTFAAFTMGIFGNIYGRLNYNVAAAPMYPAVMMLLPAGLLANGGLISAVTASDSVVADVTFTLLQVGIGIAVGLALSTSAVYMYSAAKKGSGLSTF